MDFLKMTREDIEELEQDTSHQTALEETGFWGRQGAGLMILCEKTGRFLLPLRSEEVLEPSTWGTWGGAINDGEDPKEAALREMTEEIGVQINPKEIYELYVFASGDFRYTTFVAIVDHEFTLDLSDRDQFWETADAKWFKLKDLPDNLHFGLKAILDDDFASKILNHLSSTIIKNKRSRENLFEY